MTEPVEYGLNLIKLMFGALERVLFYNAKKERFTMAKVIDITGKLTNEKPRVRISEDFEFEVNTSKNAVIKMQMLANENLPDIELMDEGLKILMGDEAYSRLEAMDLTVDGYKTVYTAVMACINNESFEDAAKRFQGK